MNSSDTPLVSIITPSFNQGQFIGETLGSVAGQTHGNIEHIIVDGGSTDDSLAIIKAYAAGRAGRTIWVSEADRGQADAINKGLRRSTGAILAYLNSDDTYVADAVERVVAFFRQNPGIGLVHGRGFHIDADGRRINAYPSQSCDRVTLFENCHMCQPTVFWRREVLDTVGEFNASLRYAMDYDYWIRASRQFQLAFMDAPLANTRIHLAAKTVHKRHDMHREILHVVKTHYGSVSDHWIYSYAHSFPLIDRLRHGGGVSRAGYVLAFCCLSAWLFLRYNRRIPLKAAGLLFRSLPQVRGRSPGMGGSPGQHG